MKIRLLILLFFLSININGQNGLIDGKYFLLQKSKNDISLCTYDNNEINEKTSYSIDENTIYTTNKKNKVAILDTAKNYIALYDISTSKRTDIKIPYDIKPKCILLNDSNIFVGGEMGSEMLIQYCFSNSKWYQLEIPIEVLGPWKAIDDIVIKDSILLAIDNIVMPKYVLFYNLNSPNRLSFLYFTELKSNGTYESIYKGRITKKYLGLMSGTFGGYGSEEHITIYNDMDLSSSFSITTERDFKEFQSFNDFVIIEDKIVIASKEKGLGKFEIKTSYFNNPKDRLDIFNPRLSTKKIDYKRFKNEEIKRLNLIPDTNKIVLTIINKFGKIRYMSIGLSVQATKFAGRNPECLGKIGSITRE